ncbi:hypothetical protein MKY41_11655 [Sporosarcina sp. FSL W7-1349]|uniref:hypothetical protein n=1 Tax=Sporosarcina sp. FSL W7-1349 TaxID=2921561 RepID=UPI0030F727DB
MKLENYKRTDIEDVLDMKRMSLHQIEQIEKCLWLDEIDQGMVRAYNLFQTLSRIRDLKVSKKKGSGMTLLINKLNEDGVACCSIKFEHKKTD